MGKLGGFGVIIEAKKKTKCPDLCVNEKIQQNTKDNDAIYNNDNDNRCILKFTFPNSTDFNEIHRECEINLYLKTYFERINKDN